MDHDDATSRRKRRTVRPLDALRLEELALAYVARFATSSGKLRSYLARKLRERGWEGEGQVDLDGLVERFVVKGFVDDEMYGRMKRNGLLARGYGARRIEQDLRAADIAEPLRRQLDPGDGARREAAIVYARRRRFGPFDDGRPPVGDEAQKQREKRLAAMIRAGHGFDAARHVIDAATIEELEEWVAEARDAD